ncbi:MAG TPA: hypothetical protein VF166_04825 [Gemmatimonadaceae bacterium]
MADTHKGDQSHSGKNPGNVPGTQTPDTPNKRESAREHGHTEEHRQHASQHGKGKEEHKRS